MAGDKRATRLSVLAMVAVILLGAVGTRLWFLQAVRQDMYQTRLDAAKQRTVYVPPERGRIFDAEGRIVADNERVLTVNIDWSVIRERPNTRRELFERLSGPLQTSVEEFERRYDSKVYSPLLPLPLKEGVDEEDVMFLQERSEDYPGVGVTQDWKRVYPYAPLASHVVGYMGAIPKEDAKDYTGRGYNLNERVGQFGVERSYETELHGTWGRHVYEIDATGSIVRELLDQAVAPVAGRDVQLTIDLDYQQYAEQALETELRYRQTLTDPAQLPTNSRDPITNELIDPNSPEGPMQYKAPAGSVVIEDYSSGHIVAMASYPTFDNRWFSAGITGSKYKQIFPESEDPDDSILVNRAISGQYNLGSTIKPFVAWSAMTSGLITAGDVFEDRGTYKLTSVDDSICAEGVKCVFKNSISAGTLQPSQYGNVRVADALAVSSDAFFYRLGEEFYLRSRTLLQEDLAQFGFGAKLGIDLPFEWSGRVPDAEIKKALIASGALSKSEDPRYLVGDNVNVSIGQGLMAATPLQLANAYSTLANNGFLLQPRVVKAIYEGLTPDAGPGFADLAAGTVLQSFDQPAVVKQLPMPPEVRDPIMTGVHRVISGPGTEYPKGRPHSPTGYTLFRSYPSKAIPVSGKTGTAQGLSNFSWNDSSAFTAFSEDETRPYTVTAYLEKSGFGSKAAAPVVKCVFTALSGLTTMDPVLPSDQLDLNAVVAAPPAQLADASCLANASTGNSRD